MKPLPLLVVLALVGCGPPPVVEPDAGAPDVLDAGTDAGGGAQDAGGGADAGQLDVDAGACSRLAQTQTADIALLDQARADLQGASSPAQRATIVQGFLDQVALRGGTPLQQSDGGSRVAFIAVDPPQAGYSVAGEWNGWTAGQTTLSQVAQSSLYAAELTLSRTRGYAYKMVDGTTFYEDRRARHVVWDGLNRGGVGEFNAMVYPERQDPSLGRLVAWRGWSSTALGDRRDVFVYLPARYDQLGCGAMLPALYFHDGNESLTRAPFHQRADEHYQANPGDSAVLVFVALPSQAQRFDEYTFSATGSRGDAYLSALKTELVPDIEADFRVCSRPADRGLSGASLGGLISARGAFRHPETFGYVGSQSGSYFWNSGELVTRAGADPVVAVRWYVDHGCPDDNCQPNRDFVAALKSKGYGVLHVEEQNGQHDWAYWRRRLPQLLAEFRRGRTGCAP